MKKVLTLAVVLAMLVSMFTMGVSAVDNYEPKTINLIANTDGTVSLPEGYVVYIGDTLVFPRGEMMLMGDFTVRSSNPPEVREMAIGLANDIMVEIDGVRIGQSWSDSLTLNNNAIKDGSKYWFEPGANIEVAGKFEFFIYSAHDAAWTEQYLIEPQIKALSIDVVDPKTVDTIVVPPTTTTPPADEPVASEDPVESTDEPTESTEEPVESTEEPAESTEEPAESTEEPAESTDEPTDVTPADNGWVIWVIVGAAVVAAVVVIVLVSKKKK